MPKKDFYHNEVKNALTKEGWKVSHDPLIYEVGIRRISVDLGAELIGAEKDGIKIAVEVKSFVGPSDVNELEKTIGQYSLYEEIIKEQEPERILYLAITQVAFDGIFSEPIGQIAQRRQKFRFIIFDAKEEVIIKWIN
jgi:hypothetical protein